MPRSFHPQVVPGCVILSLGDLCDRPVFPPSAIRACSRERSGGACLPIQQEHAASPLTTNLNHQTNQNLEKHFLKHFNHFPTSPSDYRKISCYPGIGSIP
jgi:hypothetical protein